MPFPKQNHERFTPEDIQAVAPSKPGIYGISNVMDYIYVGKAEDLRERLLRIVTKEAAQSSCIYAHRPTQWVFVVATIGQLDQMEKSLRAEYKPLCNRGQAAPARRLPQARY